MILARGDTGSSHWYGTATCWLIYDGEVPDAVRERMSGLLHALSGIAKAA